MILKFSDIYSPILRATVQFALKLLYTTFPFALFFPTDRNSPMCSKALSKQFTVMTV